MFLLVIVMVFSLGYCSSVFAHKVMGLNPSYMVSLPSFVLLLLLLCWGEIMSLWNWVTDGPFIYPSDDVWVNIKQWLYAIP
jgi:hypothetical protein